MNSARRLVLRGVLLAAVAGGWPASAQQTANSQQAAGHSPVLVNTCLISADVRRLVDFYEPVLKLKAKWSGETYAEFATGAAVLAIFSASAQEKYIPGSAQSATNKSVVLEFKVDDVDSEYKRLQGLVKNWVKLPATQPWGTRSIYFRDPDGNLVDFYALAPQPQ